MPVLAALCILAQAPAATATGTAPAAQGASSAPVTGPLTLAEAVAGAMEQAGQLIRTDALRGEADAVRRQAGAWTADDPALRLKGLSDRFNSDDGAYELEAFVDLPLWLPGQRRARLELARSLGMGADALTRLLRWEVTGAVRDALWRAKLAEVQQQQARAAYQAATALEAVVAKRFDAGELARLDLLTAEQETLARQAELTAAEAAWEQAKADYVQLTGRLSLPEPANWPSRAPSPLPSPSSSPSSSPASSAPSSSAPGTAPVSGVAFGSAPRSASNRALGPALGPALGRASGRNDASQLMLPDDHPLLAEADAALARARSERDRVASDRRGNPVLSLGGRRSRDDRAFGADTALQLEVSIPFGLRSQSALELAASERQVTERLAELHRLRREAERELAGAVLGRAGAAKALQVAERRARLAADALKVAERAFELGETDLADRLRAERRAREAHLDLALRRAEQGQALARLNQALGIIPQ